MLGHTLRLLQPGATACAPRPWPGPEAPLSWWLAASSRLPSHLRGCRSWGPSSVLTRPQRTGHRVAARATHAAAPASDPAPLPQKGQALPSRDVLPICGGGWGSEQRFSQERPPALLWKGGALAGHPG